jgi:hypothetical protein
MTFRQFVRRILPTFVVARIDYHLRPHVRDSWGGAFNGQCGRQQIFIDLLSAFSFTHIVETGTFKGTTTEYLARESRLPVFTVEANPKVHQFAKLRFRRYPQIRLFLGDSRLFLRRLPTLLPPSVCRPFFYLDAHWQLDLPLLEELEMVLGKYPECVIMIDDFKVPGDSGYRFDDYGEGRALCSEYLAPVFETLNPAVAYPLLPSSRESGGKRGCIVLVSPALKDILPGVASVQQAVSVSLRPASSACTSVRPLATEAQTL